MRPPAEAAIVAHIEAHDTIEGCPELKAEHLPVVDCAFPPPQGGRSIAWREHLGMMAAAQPWISGAISKWVVGGTIIATDAGMIRIGSLYRGEQPDTFRALDTRRPLRVPTGNRTHNVAKDFYYAGIKPTYRVTLADGRELTGTAVHRLRAARPRGLDWAVLPDLAPGDYVGLCLGSECWGVDFPLPPLKLSPRYGCQHAISVPAVAAGLRGTFLGMLVGHLPRPWP